MIEKSLRIPCDCHFRGHEIEFSLFTSDDGEKEEVTVSYYLCPGTFWKRLKLGIKYILGYHPTRSHFDDAIWFGRNGEQAILREVADHLDAVQAQWAKQN